MSDTIQVRILGRGLIPRIGTLAPKLDPIKADLTLLTLILNTKGLSVEYLNPADGKFVPLNKSNLRRVYNDLRGKEATVAKRVPPTPKNTEEVKKPIEPPKEVVVPINPPVTPPIVNEPPVAETPSVVTEQTPTIIDPPVETSSIESTPTSEAIEDKPVDETSTLSVVLDTDKTNIPVENDKDSKNNKSYESYSKKDKYKYK